MLQSNFKRKFKIYSSFDKLPPTPISPTLSDGIINNKGYIWFQPFILDIKYIWHLSVLLSAARWLTKLLHFPKGLAFICIPHMKILSLTEYHLTFLLI